MKKRKALVTGGASFIGSQLVDALVNRGAGVRVVDNLSSGRTENIAKQVEAGTIEFLEQDLTDPGVTRKIMAGVEVFFHLAADHGGRGHVDIHQVECSTNLVLDGMIFKTAYEMGVEKVVYGSSGCIYPNHIQMNPGDELFLTEDRVGPPYDAENSLTRQLLAWQLGVSFIEGLHRTIDWYFAHKNRAQVKAILQRILLER